METLYRNYTWDITYFPKSRKPIGYIGYIGYRWIYKIKYEANGEIERYKTRLNAKGYN